MSATAAPPKYADFILLDLGLPKEDDPKGAFRFTVHLKACPKYKSGAYYVGRMTVGGTEFKVKAIIVQSTAGGRGWYSWDERLEDKLERHCLGDSNPRSVNVKLSRDGEPELIADAIVIIHPMSEYE